jgi:hypothetical protein
VKPIGCDRLGRPRRFSVPAVSGKQPTAKAFWLAERDTKMSEEKTNYMQELDLWTETNVITPLHEAVVNGDSADCDATCEQVKKAIREKVLESYRNGLKAPRKSAAQPRRSYAR